jgi:regulatory protein
MNRAPLSLQARAMAWLAQREQSRSELRRKLLRVARVGIHPDDEAADGAELIASVERILDALQAANCLSDERFVESRVRVREARFGTRRIQQELQQHGLRLGDEQLLDLKASEWQRASLLWRRRFAQASADPHERARQMRFLAGRGFPSDVIRRVVAGDIAPPPQVPA